jgi:hypothetical protein
MKSGHIITMVVLLAVALLIAWIARNTYWDEVTVPMPIKGEARTNSMYAAQRLAETLGATVHAQRRRDSLPDASAVIYLSYWSWNLVPSRREQLQRWVESGGRLVADRSLIGGERELEDWTGIERSKLPASEDDASGRSEGSERGDDCVELETETAAPDPSTTRAFYFVCGVDHGSRLTSRRRPGWILSDAAGMQALRVDIGRGSFTLLNANPFENRELFEGDNALLFVAATGIDRGDSIHLLSEEKSRSLLDLIWMHGAPVVMLSLGVIALALWRGGLRFGPPAGVPDPARRSLAEQIVGTGRFTLRFGGGRALHAAAVRALHETAHRYVTGYAGMQSDTRIAALARNTGLDESSLAEAINYAGPRRAGELRKVLALLETARRRIS